MWYSLFQRLLWWWRTQKNHYLRTEDIQHCWMTAQEEIRLRSVRNCHFILWKSSGVVVPWQGRFERVSQKQTVPESF
jgi:hypothetical protein